MIWPFNRIAELEAQCQTQQATLDELTTTNRELRKRAEDLEFNMAAMSHYYEEVAIYQMTKEAENGPNN